MTAELGPTVLFCFAAVVCTGARLAKKLFLSAEPGSPDRHRSKVSAPTRSTDPSLSMRAQGVVIRRSGTPAARVRYELVGYLRQSSLWESPIT